MAFPFLAVLPVISEIISKIIPDPQEAAKAKLRMMELVEQGEQAFLDANMRVALAQLEVNREEAKAGPYRGGWRPFIGWVCGAAFAYNFVALPILTWLALIVKIPVPPAAFDLTVMLPVLLGMLGLGGMRTFEKSKGQI